MVVQGIIALALALPTGMLFGVGYGTGVRVGYEQVYPLLFPAQLTTGRPDPKVTSDNIKSINKIYDAIGGKEASQMGIAKGLEGAMSELDTNPDFRALMELELSASGNTLQSSRDRNKSPEPTSSQAGFLSDTERASALEQLKINRQKTILENQQFIKRNKLDPITLKKIVPKPEPKKVALVSKTPNYIVLRVPIHKDEPNAQRIGLKATTFTGTWKTIGYRNTRVFIQRALNRAIASHNSLTDHVKRKNTMNLIKALQLVLSKKNFVKS